MKSDQVIGGLFSGTGSPYRETFELKGDILHPFQLLDVLDLSRPGMREIAHLHHVGDESAALLELLWHYRQRNTVAWSAWPAEQSGEMAPSPSGLAALKATDDDKRVAENAMQGVFQPYNAFPPTQYAFPLDWDWDPHGNIEWPAHMLCTAPARF